VLENNFFNAENVQWRVHPHESDRNSDEATIASDANIPFDPKQTSPTGTQPARATNDRKE